MVAVPPDPTPLTMPVDPTVATPVLLLLQVPPELASVSTRLVPTQVGVLPVIAEIAFTVAMAVALQPVLST